MFVDAIESGRWLVIDELNRSNFDRAFGQLFTVLSGQPVVLPFKRRGQAQPDLARARRRRRRPTTPTRSGCPASWRIIATMNVFDKNLLFEMSYALMRRFAFIEVTCPSDEAYHELLEGPGDIVRELLPLRRFRDLGPAVYLDAAKFAVRRMRGPAAAAAGCSTRCSTPTSCRSSRASTTSGRSSCTRPMAELLDDAEQAEAQRTIGEVLGTALPV